MCQSLRAITLRRAVASIAALTWATAAWPQADWQTWQDRVRTAPIELSDAREVPDGEGGTRIREDFSGDLRVDADNYSRALANVLARGPALRDLNEVAPLFESGVASANIQRMTDANVEVFVVGDNAERTDRFRDVVIILKTKTPFPASPTQLLRPPNPDATGGICSGVFVSDATILTAAHCVCDLGLETETGRELTAIGWGRDFHQLVRLPTSFRVSQPNFAPLSRDTPPVTMNPRFCELFRATGRVIGPDIALVYLNKDAVAEIHAADRGPSHRPAIFAWPDLFMSPIHSHATVVGYGITDISLVGSAQPFGVKVTANIPIVDMICGNPLSVAAFDCQIGEEIVLIDQLFGNDTCNGDSGGPVYLRYFGRFYLVGITSRAALPGTNCGAGGIYTLLNPRVLAWVRRNTLFDDPTF